MHSIYEATALQAIIERINKLSPASQAQWGKMDVSQMLAHCAVPIEIALGEKKGKITLLGTLLGRFVKSSVVGAKPFKRSLPTNPDFVVADKREFVAEKQRLIAALTRFSKAGATKLEGQKHPFFGKLTANEWSVLVTKHMDHHLSQFGA